MKKYLSLLLLSLVFLSSCKDEQITAVSAESRFQTRLVGRWTFSSFATKTNNADGTVTDNGTQSTAPASSISFYNDGTVRIIDFGRGEAKGTYKIISDNEFSMITPSGNSYCRVETMSSKNFAFTGRVNNSDGSADFTTYFLADRAAL
ncbi:MAG: hypothetical protein INR69_20015 [Mucilaginibacter polytrichastri]|nr:hypothetical protein [Mucilaginibacter polytrichastri]